MVLIFMFSLINFLKNYKLILGLMKFYNLMIFILIYLLYMHVNFYSGWMFIYNSVGIDLYSWSLMMLTFWIYLMMLMVSKKLGVKMGNYFNIMNFMLLFLILCFSSMNMILFYIYFEISLIPVFMLILGWGFQIERIQAGYYMMLYTLFGSMPLFLVIMHIYMVSYSLMWMIIEFHSVYIWGFLSLTMAFFIKMPMYMVHSWLFRAHVEAPIMGSMILAGVMLKLGGYGLMRVVLIMMKLGSEFSKYFIVVSLMGGLISCIICLVQVDMKMLVAYSSVVHMSLLLGGVLILFEIGGWGSMMMMISHGLCSSGLFVLVNISYERLYSRSLYINKGLINYFPSLSLMWFFLCSSNLSFPPSLNLFSEIMLLSSLLMWGKVIMLILIFLSFFSAFYSLYLYSYSQFGKFNYMNLVMIMINVNEFIVLLFHWIPLNFIFLLMFIFL